jgi:hypothetical protein
MFKTVELKPDPERKEKQNQIGLEKGCYIQTLFDGRLRIAKILEIKAFESKKLNTSIFGSFITKI